ncbi:MAG: cysteine desulfurase [Oscillospiraceae bacterium]|jgi:cysteine desulfurase|nr:cysteine desulfurase [Oscillospiraceae bacterium]
MNFKEIYFDNSASTKPSDTVSLEVYKTLSSNFANPSSMHTKGYESAKIVAQSRKKIADVLKCESNEIYFTSGGTESNNIAILGSVYAKKHKGNKIVTSSCEHFSVLKTCKELESKGFEVVYLKPDKNGKIHEEQIFNAVDSNTIFVSIMAANNETGVCFPVEKIKNIIKQKSSDAIFHIDAVQSFCKIETKISKLKCDLLTVSAHKMHGPQGIGALFCSNKIKIHPLIFGGDQERKIRPGTESVSLISGFAKAVEESKNFDKNFLKVSELFKMCKNSFKNFQNVKINGSSDFFPYILNISFLGIKSEILLNFLSLRNIFVSSASACSKNKKSHVLKAMGLPSDRISSSIRISFSKNNTKEEVLYFLKVIDNALEALKNKNTSI